MNDFNVMMTTDEFHDEPDVISDEDYSQYVREEWGPNRLPKVEMSEEEVLTELAKYSHLPPIKLIP